MYVAIGKAAKSFHSISTIEIPGHRSSVWPWGRVVCASNVNERPGNLFSLGNLLAQKTTRTTLPHTVQGSAKRWALGCVNPAFWIPLAAGGVFTEPRVYLLANPCTHTHAITRRPNDSFIRGNVRGGQDRAEEYRVTGQDAIQETEKWAEWAALASAADSAHFSISCMVWHPVQSPCIRYDIHCGQRCKRQ